MIERIHVTRPFLPPLEEFQEYLENIWQSHQLTNAGPYHEAFEEELAKYLGVKYISLFANGTLALITALQALKITGEVITTPYSFVATTHSLWWNGIKPVFVDIEPGYLNLDPEKIEAAITPQTTAILPVHVYGNPCYVERIGQIADTYGLKVIYDACHTFGGKLKGESVASFGDLSILSFHATKVFNTFEGGAIVCHDEKTKRRIDFLKNFGFADETVVVAPGINAKMNEFQAALGILQLKYVDRLIEKRKNIAEIYHEAIKQIKGVRLLGAREGCCYNHPYFPVFIDRNEYGKDRDEVYEHYKEHNIYTRRYFYPLISQFPTYKGLPSALPENLPVAEKATREVLCLPIYPDLSTEDAHRIMEILKKFGGR